MKNNYPLPEIPSDVIGGTRQFDENIRQCLKDLTVDLINDINGGVRSLEINDDDYTMQDIYVYDIYVFDNLTAVRDFNLPTHADYNGKGFLVINLDGSYDIDVNPEDRGGGDIDYINDWQYKFPITEKYGILKVSKLSDRWLVTPLNDACIYEVSSETPDAGLALDGTWDDVAGMALTLPATGKGFCSSFFRQVSANTTPAAVYISLQFGLGSVSGNHAPDIYNGLGEYVQVSGAYIWQNAFDRIIPEFKLNASGQTLYLKTKVDSNSLPCNTHSAWGYNDLPMFIRWRRIY